MVTENVIIFFLQQSLFEDGCSFCSHLLSFVNWINQLRKKQRELWSFSLPFSGFSPSGPWPWGELLITGPSVPAEILIGTRWSSTISRVPAGAQECGAGLCCPATSCPLLSQAVCPTPLLTAHWAPWHSPGCSQPWDPESQYPHLKPVCILVLAETRVKAASSGPQVCAAASPCSAAGFFVCSWTTACSFYLEFRNQSTFNPGLVCVHRLLSGLLMASWYCTQQWDWTWDPLLSHVTPDLLCFLTRWVQSFIQSFPTPPCFRLWCSSHTGKH